MGWRKKTRRLQDRIIDLEHRLHKFEKSVEDIRCELTRPLKPHDVLDPERWLYTDQPQFKTIEKITLAGKVDRIIEHLGLDIEVKQKECAPARITVRAKKRKEK